jgi:hypothetical protein
MTVPDYIISRTIAAEHRQRQLRDTPDTDLPEPRPRSAKSSDRITIVRRQMSAALHSVADRIEPQPVCGC